MKVTCIILMWGLLTKFRRRKYILMVLLFFFYTVFDTTDQLILLDKIGLSRWYILHSHWVHVLLFSLTKHSLEAPLHAYQPWLMCNSFRDQQLICFSHLLGRIIWFKIASLLWKDWLPLRPAQNRIFFN